MPFLALSAYRRKADKADRHGPTDNLTMSTLQQPYVLFDFSHPDAVHSWAPIDDRVMGGISRSGLRHDTAGHALFEGEVSLERNGGFASVRSRPGAYGLADAEACLIDVRGTDKQHKLSLLTDDGFDSLNYQTSFAPTGNDWRTIQIALASFRASSRGRDVAGAPPLDPARIRQLDLMISGRQSGPFALDIQRIALA